MRHQICITLDEQTHYKIREKMRNVKFKSKSKLIETAIMDFLEGEDE
tara:strand:- start:1721 stop:1861 length:141 start_codon:yes stop_codon:yes gene_type:complete